MEKYYFKDGFMEIHEIQISFNKSARLTAKCYYQQGREQTMKYIDIIGEEYTNWLNDDNYLISLAGYKAGMGERVMPISNFSHLDEFKPFTPYTFTSGIPATVAPATVAPATVAPATVAPATVAPDAAS